MRVHVQNDRRPNIARKSFDIFLTFIVISKTWARGFSYTFPHEWMSHAVQNHHHQRPPLLLALFSQHFSFLFFLLSSFIADNLFDFPLIPFQFWFFSFQLWINPRHRERTETTSGYREMEREKRSGKHSAQFRRKLKEIREENGIFSFLYSFLLLCPDGELRPN